MNNFIKIFSAILLFFQFPENISAGSCDTLSTQQVTADTICPYEPGHINIKIRKGISYFWYDKPSGGNLIGTGSSFTTRPLAEPDTFYIESKGSSGCASVKRIAVTISQFKAPVARFNTSMPQTKNGILIQFNNASESARSFQWNFGDTLSHDNISADEHPSHVYTTAGQYRVQLIAVNDKGCNDTLYRVVNAQMAHSIFIPAAFTPNDDDNNNIFRVRGSNIRSASIKIFNQWGQLIHHSEDNKWDGKVKGEIVQNGTYLYIIDVNYENGTSENFKGPITVIR